MKMKKRLKVLDLFSGIGGFSLGLEQTGEFETVAFCEWDEHCQKVLRKHWPKTPIFGDIQTLDCSMIRDYSNTGIDVICGGYPCTGHSTAGKKKGFNNEASALWRHYKRVIGYFLPSYIIIENSANLRTTGLGELLSDLWSFGYHAEWEVISARSVGAEHLRERLYIVAWREPAPYPDSFRLWRSASEEATTPRGWTERPAYQRDLFLEGRRYQPTVGRSLHGLSPWMVRLEKERKIKIQQLGNSLIPRIPYLIGKAITTNRRSFDER